MIFKQPSTENLENTGKQGLFSLISHIHRSHGCLCLPAFFFSKTRAGKIGRGQVCEPCRLASADTQGITIRRYFKVAVHGEYTRAVMQPDRHLSWARRSKDSTDAAEDIYQERVTDQIAVLLPENKQDRELQSTARLSCSDT